MSTYRKNKRNSIIMKTVLFALGLVLSVFIIKKIKYSDFMQSMNQNSPVSTPCASKLPSTNYSAELNSFLFQQDTTGTKEIGITETITSDENNLYYNINYPVTGMDAIDNIIQADVDNTLAAFKQSFADYVAPNADTRPYLSMDYHSFLTGDSISSFVLYLQYDSPNYANPVKEVRTHNFFLTNGKEITLSDILIGDYIELFSFRTKSYVNANPNFYIHTGQEEYASGYSADINNFTKFALSNNGLTLHFDPFTIAPGELGCLSFTIPANEILPYFIYDPFKNVDVPVPDVPTTNNGPFTIDPDKPMVALTFDDGPNSQTTGKILDTLEKYNCHATFFVIGNLVPTAPHVLNRALELGCDIGSHSYNHARLSRLKKDNIKSQFSKSLQKIKKATGKKYTLVRTPYGEHTPKIMKSVKYPVILWSIDTEDWKSRNKKKILNKVIGKVKDGDIILMHDIYDTTADAVKIMVPKLLKEGFQLVTVREMFEAKGIKLKKGKAFFNAR